MISGTAGGFDRLVRRRRMTRAFSEQPVEDETLRRIADLARRAPSAGNTMAVEFLALSGAEQTSVYWDTTLAEREDFAWPDLLRAPLLVMIWVRPQAYVERYGEPDKAHSGLGAGLGSWQTPYWFVDGGAAAMLMLLAAEAEGLGALFFGMFDHETAVREAFGVPADRRCIGVVALGHRAGHRPSRSASRRRPALDEIMHSGAW